MPVFIKTQGLRKIESKTNHTGRIFKAPARVDVATSRTLKYGGRTNQSEGKS